MECILFTDLLNKHTPFEHIAATLPQKHLHEFQNLPRSGGYLQSSGGVKAGCPEPLLTEKGIQNCFSCWMIKKVVCVWIFY